MSKIYLLSNQKHQDVENLDVFKIEYIKQDIDFKYYDALIFTSKNGVYSAEYNSQDWRDIPSYIISAKSASLVKKLSGKIEFIGEASHGNEFAYELIDRLQNKKVLYLRAENIVSNLLKILRKNNIDLDDKIGYKTIFNRVQKNLEDNSVFIFTSPSSVKYFFQQYEWKDSYKAILIGKTTAKFFPKNIKYLISKTTSIEECIKLAKNNLYN